MRTPFSRVTGLGSAKSGTGHFIQQRLTALANVPLSLFLIWRAVCLARGDHASVAELFSDPPFAALMVLAIISFSWHMRLGVQVVIEDYVHGEGAKLAAVIANALFSYTVMGMGIVFTLKLALAG